ncbi:hypothetical protein F511_45106 [Dorcoceras hygrometricum]|uniref:Uncharacterized protein n=1 Tax=Dorcoceras hygrometricum TaxID=472368 RepID=A0A2Z7A4M2_9LAMI|nr:hypothetical protein F511_45106 [Dorcoceras hygrometricum]
MVRNISISSWFDAFKESAVELAMETSRVTSALDYVLRSLLKKKKKISFISTVDESINSRYSRRRRSVDGAGTKKFSRKLQLEIQQMMLSAKEKRRRIVNSADDENQQMKRSARGEATSYGNSAGC